MEDGAFAGTAADWAPSVIWLRDALLDRQIVDLEGRRVIRVGDVVLEDREGSLEVTAVEVGLAAVLRRLGLARLAARFPPQLLPIDRLHLASEAAGGLLLDAPRERLEELDEATVTTLLSRLPVPAAEHAVRTSRHRGAVADHARARRLRAALPAEPVVSRLRIAAFLAVLGPGVLAGLSDDDPAGITTYSILGADHGYALLWVLVVATAHADPLPRRRGAARRRHGTGPGRARARALRRRARRSR